MPARWHGWNWGFAWPAVNDASDDADIACLGQNGRLMAISTKMSDSMATKEIPKQYYSTREAAKLLGVSLTTAQIMVEKGELQAWKTSGGHRRISVEAVEKALRQRQQGGSVRSSSGRQYAVVIAEDDPTLCKLYEKTINTWKMPISLTIVPNGLEVTFLIERIRPDLLILDLKMPRMDGFQLLKIIRGHPEYDAMDIVVVSGMDSAEIAKRGGLAPGVTEFPKPVPWPQLRGYVQAAMSRRALSASR